jgi:hypothetical protein
VPAFHDAPRRHRSAVLSSDQDIGDRPKLHLPAGVKGRIDEALLGFGQPSVKGLPRDDLVLPDGVAA